MLAPVLTEFAAQPLLKRVPPRFLLHWLSSLYICMKQLGLVQTLGCQTSGNFQLLSPEQFRLQVVHVCMDTVQHSIYSTPYGPVTVPWASLG